MASAWRCGELGCLRSAWPRRAPKPPTGLGEIPTAARSATLATGSAACRAQRRRRLLPEHPRYRWRLAPYTVSFTADATNQGLRVSDDRVTFDLNGHVYTTSDANVAMQLGTVSGDSGRLSVMDGIVILPFQSDLQIASTSGGSGLLAVAAGGLVIGSPDLFVGLNGNGTLNIFDNGDLIASNATLGLNSNVTGTATITGAGSSLLADQLLVGSNGIGVLNVIGGGRVDSTDGIIGDAVGSSGTVTVSGANSRWQMSHWLRVGFSGGGNVEN